MSSDQSPITSSSEQSHPSERDLQKPVLAKGDEAYQTLANEAGRRVWVVLQNLIEVRTRASKTQSMTGEEVNALLMGAMSGIGTIVARMSLKVTNAAPDAPPAEELILNDLAGQFLETIRQMRENDPIAKMMFETRGASEHAS